MGPQGRSRRGFCSPSRRYGTVHVTLNCIVDIAWIRHPRNEWYAVERSWLFTAYWLCQTTHSKTSRAIKVWVLPHSEHYINSGFENRIQTYPNDIIIHGLARISEIQECPRRGRFPKQQFQPAHQTLMRLTNRPWTASKAARLHASQILLRS